MTVTTIRPSPGPSHSLERKTLEALSLTDRIVGAAGHLLLLVSVLCPLALNPGARSVQTWVGGRLPGRLTPHSRRASASPAPQAWDLPPPPGPRPQTSICSRKPVSSPPPASLSSQRSLKIPGVILDENSRISQTSTGPFLSAGDERGPRTKANIPGRGCLSAERRTPCVTSRHCVGSGDEGGLQHSR